MLTKQEIRQLDDKALQEEITANRNELLKIQFNVRNGTSKESHLVKKLRRYTARLETIKRELAAESPVKKEVEGTSVKEEKISKKTKTVSKKSEEKKEKVATRAKKKTSKAE